MRSPGPQPLRCSFCAKPEQAVGKLISSPGRDAPSAYICDECIAVCVSILEEDEPEPAPSTAGSAEEKHPLLDHPLASRLLTAVERWMREESLGSDTADALAEVRRIAQAMMTLPRRP